MAFIAVLPGDVSLWLDMSLIIAIHHKKGLCWGFAEPGTTIYNQSSRSLVGSGWGRAEVMRAGNSSGLTCLGTTVCHSQGLGPSMAQHKPMLLQELQGRPLFP